jgi:hypothetical protein
MIIGKTNVVEIDITGGHIPARQINAKLSLEIEKAVMSNHIEVPAQRYRIRFMTIISSG